VTQTSPGDATTRPPHGSRRGYLVAAVLIVALVAAAITAGVLLADDDDDTGTTVAVTTTLEDVVPTTSTTVAPSPTVAGTRYRDEVFLDVTMEADLQYGSAPGADGAPVTLLLDLYQPKGDTATDRAAIVWVHGGGFKNGDKAEGVPAVMAPMLAKHGYVVVSINYRLLAPDSCSGASGVSPACYDAATKAVHDGLAAVRWLRANAEEYGLDPDDIGIGGESAGAIIATGVGVHADDPGQSGNPGFDSTVDGWFSISGGLPGGLFVDATDAPGYLISGTADVVVPYQWSVDTDTALRAAGVESTLVTLDGAGHVPFAEYGDVMRRDSIAFFYDALDLAAA
jgi:acetyl esterase/lipase